VRLFVFQSLVSVVAVDAQGRRVKSAITPVERTMLEHAHVHRAFRVIAVSRPARHQIAAEHVGGIRAWVEILRDRPLVADERLLSLASGLAAGLAGDWIVSTSVLMPQLEFLVRRLPRRGRRADVDLERRPGRNGRAAGPGTQLWHQHARDTIQSPASPAARR